jgi:hypothetical protein
LRVFIGEELADLLGGAGGSGLLLRSKDPCTMLLLIKVDAVEEEEEEEKAEFSVFFRLDPAVRPNVVAPRKPTDELFRGGEGVPLGGTGGERDTSEDGRERF